MSTQVINTWKKGPWMECVPRKASQDEVRLTQPQLSSNVMEIMDMLNGRSRNKRKWLWIKIKINHRRCSEKKKINNKIWMKILASSFSTEIKNDLNFVKHRTCVTAWGRCGLTSPSKSRGSYARANWASVPRCCLRDWRNCQKQEDTQQSVCSNLEIFETT